MGVSGLGFLGLQKGSSVKGLLRVTIRIPASTLFMSLNRVYGPYWEIIKRIRILKKGRLLRVWVTATTRKLQPKALEGLCIVSFNAWLGMSTRSSLV